MKCFITWCTRKTTNWYFKRSGYVTSGDYWWRHFAPPDAPCEMRLWLSLCTTHELWNLNRFQQTGPSNEPPRSGRLRVATPGQDRYIRVFHRTASASTTAVGIHGLRRISSKKVRNGFDSMAFDPEAYILERYWRRYTDVKHTKGLDILKRSQNLV